MDELRRQLRALPEELAAEAGNVVTQYANAAMRAVQSNYPVRQTGFHPTKRRKSSWFPPGNLKARMSVNSNLSKVTTTAIVRATAPHAHLYEFGTKKRYHDNGKSVGAMPKATPDKSSIVIYMRVRANMIEALKDIVRKAGMEVD